jgi:hypothetical protein
VVSWIRQLVKEPTSFKGATNVLKIYDNLAATPRMLKHLESNEHFRIENLDDLNAQIPLFVWCLLARARAKSGEIEIIKGPHYELSTIKIRDTENLSSTYLFRVSGRLICLTISKDLDFDPDNSYELDLSRAEFFVYPTIIDLVDMPG